MLPAGPDLTPHKGGLQWDSSPWRGRGKAVQLEKEMEGNVFVTLRQGTMHETKLNKYLVITKIQDLSSKSTCRKGPRQRDSEMYTLLKAVRGLTRRIHPRTQEKQRETQGIVSKSSAQNLVGPLLHHNLAVSTASHA